MLREQSAIGEPGQRITVGEFGVLRLHRDLLLPLLSEQLLLRIRLRDEPTMNERTDIVEEARAVRLEILRDEVAGRGFRRLGRFAFGSNIWANHFRPHSLWILWINPFWDRRPAGGVQAGSRGCQRASLGGRETLGK